MKWSKNIINRYNNNEISRYEWVSDKGHTIDVYYSRDKDQNYAGSNQVNVFVPKYGGWSLGTPKNFRTKKDVIKFVSYAKKQLEKGVYGEQVSFPK